MKIRMIQLAAAGCLAAGAAQAQLSDGMIKAGILNGISTLHSPPTGSDSIPDEGAKLAAGC